MQVGDALQGGGVMDALRPGLKAYAEEWLAVLDLLGRPYLDGEAHKCSDLHPRCPEWAAIVSASLSDHLSQAFMQI